MLSQASRARLIGSILLLALPVGGGCVPPVEDSPVTGGKGGGAAAGSGGRGGSSSGSGGATATGGAGGLGTGGASTGSGTGGGGGRASGGTAGSSDAGASGGSGGRADAAGNPGGSPLPAGPHKVVLLVGDTNVNDQSRLQMIEILSSLKESHGVTLEIMDSRVAKASVLTGRLVIAGPNNNYCSDTPDPGLKTLPVPLIVTRDCKTTAIGLGTMMNTQEYIANLPVKITSPTPTTLWPRGSRAWCRC